MDPLPIALNKDLADRIDSLLNASRSPAFELYEFAASIRRENLKLKKKRMAYSEAFVQFWRTFDMDSRFGSLSNFTKYAEAGELILRVRRDFPGHDDRLPTSLRPLYEIWQLKADELKICFEDTFRRDEVTDNREKWEASGEPLITPTTTAAQITAWRNKWRNPGSTLIRLPLTLAKITIDPTLLKEADGTISEESRSAVSRICADLKQRIAELKNPAYDADTRENEVLESLDEAQLSTNEIGAKKQLLADWRFENYVVHVSRAGSRFYIPDGPNGRYVRGLLASYFGKFETEVPPVMSGFPSRKMENRVVLVSPTRAEFYLELMKEYYARFGARRLLAVAHRASRSGPWFDGQLRKVVALEHELKLKQELMFASGASRTDRLEAKARVEEIQNILPPPHEGKDDDQLTEVAERALKGLANQIEANRRPAVVEAPAIPAAAQQQIDPPPEASCEAGRTPESLSASVAAA
jgi:hypothetical protein